MKQLKRIAVVVFLMTGGHWLNAQIITQTIKGKVIDSDSQEPLTGANIIILDTDPVIGTTSDPEGRFRLENVPVGRYNIKFSFVGYKEATVSELLVTSGKEVVLNIHLSEDLAALNEVVVTAGKSGEAINSMSTVSSRSISTEMTQRYAGGLDDPSRLVSVFAGVTTDGSVESNAVMIRGNTPTGVLWQIEGVEVPVPSHFSNAEVLGGGAITLFSNHMLGTSDFFTGAFPAEYGNATSGVFDMNLRTGNNEQREHAFKVGILGIDLASEGPFKKGSNSSYLFNYRYSTMGLVSSLLPDGGLPEYQDLCFNLDFPTKKAGTFSLWGIGGMSRYTSRVIEDPDVWSREDDRLKVIADFMSGTSSLKHKKRLGSRTFIQNSLTASSNNQETTEDLRNLDGGYDPSVKFNYHEYRYAAKSVVNHKFGSRHTNRTGVSYTYVDYDFDHANAVSGEFGPVSYSQGNTSYLQAFTQSKFRLTEQLSACVGVHALYLTLNDKSSFDPRIGLSWSPASKHTFSVGYGQHTQTQFFNVYFVQREEEGRITYPNKNLELSKAQHFVLGYDLAINANIHLKVEPYYQILSDIPVVENGSFAMTNLLHFHRFDEVLVSEGKGRNYGVDLTLERNLSKGYYYIMTATLYESKYTGGDGVERNSAFNNKYVVNVLAGKEWQFKKRPNNLMGVNGRLYLKGGNPVSPVDQEASREEQTVVEDETRAFADTWPSYYRADLSLYFRMNKPKYSMIFSAQINNCLNSPTYYTRQFNYKLNAVEEIVNNAPFPEVSWKIEF